MDRKVRVRFAPSPTGPLHIGGVRTALYNWLFAKKHGGDFLLRIEDTDQNRFVPGAEEYIIESLKWLGIEPVEGIGFGDGPHAPYRQSDRKPMYRQYADLLLEKDLAYYAFDTPQELEDMRERMKASNIEAKYDAITRQGMKNSLTLSEDEVKHRIESGENYVIRTKLPRKEEVRFHDEIRGWVVFNTSQMDDKVLMKSDGMPTYHLANVVDDYLMQISHVIRGEEWLPSAPLHVLLYRYFGWEDVMPKFAHLPLLLKPEGNGKLSKRDGDRLGFPVFPLQWQDPVTNEISSGYRESGYYPQAVLNMLALLGWHPSNNQEVFSTEELIEAFSIEKISKSGAKFDLHKAHWFNQYYLRNKSDLDLAKSSREWIEKAGYHYDENYVEQVCRLAKEKINFVSELPSYASYFFEEPSSYDQQVIAKKWKDFMPDFVVSVAKELEQITDWSIVNIEAAFNKVLSEKQLQSKDVLQAFRTALTGVGGGPPIFDMAQIIGQQKIISRLKKAALIPVSQA
ncbi:MAG: glutamate--tRNA ligase [Bacteroidetes bacterium]|nr:glutamate--tRNA ligase [Bacteroidota bacterium]